MRELLAEIALIELEEIADRLLTDELGIDELDRIELVMIIEGEFGIDLPTGAECEWERPSCIVRSIGEARR